MTSDGAILSEDDPLSLVLSSPELKTCITNWKASPAEERYLECCDALGIRKYPLEMFYVDIFIYFIGKPTATQ